MSEERLPTGRTPPVVIGPNEYQCAMCKGVFQKCRDQEEVMAEAVENFGADVVATESHSTVCDECYKLFMVWLGSGSAPRN